MNERKIYREFVEMERKRQTERETETDRKIDRKIKEKKRAIIRSRLLLTHYVNLKISFLIHASPPTRKHLR